MSTIHSSPAFGCIRPNRAHKLLQRLAALLALEEARRRPPPVSLPSRLTRIPDLHSPHRQQSSACNANHILRCNGRIYCCESEPEDGKGPYTTTSFCKGTRASSNVLNAPSPMATKAAPLLARPIGRLPPGH